jgi:glycosyltransferase involved in cell wall biosynthesis
MNVSVIIVNYQQGQFLIPLLKYLWSSAKDWFPYQVEILVIDNLSPESENLKQILWEQEQNIEVNIKTTYLFLDKNYGPSYSRNKGVEQANGEYIQFIDADDWIDPIKIITQYNFAIKNGYPSFVTSKWARVTRESTWDSKKDVSIHQPHFTNPIPISLIKNDGFIHLASGLIKKESFLKAGGFREDMWLVEDVRFLIDLYQVESNFTIYPSDKPLFFYRVGQTQSLSSSRKLDFCNACYSNAVYVEELIGFDKLGEFELKVLLEVYGQLARFFFEHDRTNFSEVLARIHNINPKYIPSNPKALQQLSKCLGYERAEAIALKYRQIKYFTFRQTNWAVKNIFCKTNKVKL